MIRPTSWFSCLPSICVFSLRFSLLSICTVLLQCDASPILLRAAVLGSPWDRILQSCCMREISLRHTSWRLWVVDVLNFVFGWVIKLKQNVVSGGRGICGRLFNMVKCVKYNALLWTFSHTLAFSEVPSPFSISAWLCMCVWIVKEALQYSLERSASL